MSCLESWMGAVKYAPFSQLFICWLSDCFQIYLRNTERITSQYLDALSEVQRCMISMVLNTMGTNLATVSHGELDLRMDDLEDKD